MKSKKINYIWVPPIITLCIVSILYAINGIFPFGESTTAVNDGIAQYLPFLSEFAYKIKEGGSLFFSWHAGRGINFWANLAYYLSSPLNFIALLFPVERMDDAFSIITLIKLALMSLTFSIYLRYTYRRNDLSIVIFPVVWSLSAFTIGTTYLLTWADALIFFPLVIMGLKRLMDGHSGWIYALFLGLTIASNFYIGYIVCLFCVIFFVYSLISDEEIVYEGVTSNGGAEDETEDDNVNIINIFKKSYLLSTGFRFALSSILGGLLTAVLTIPTSIALTHTGKGETVTDKFVISDIWNVFASHIFPVKNIYETIAVNDILFCFVGIVSVILAVNYFFLKGVSTRKKIGNLFLLLVMWASISVYAAYIVWHAFSVPAGIMQRFAFVYSFIILKIAYETFVNIDKIRLSGIVCGVALSFVCVVGIRLSNIMYDNFYSVKLLVTLIIFILLYAVIIAIMSKKVKFKMIGETVLIIAIVAEMTILNTDNLYVNNWKSDIEQSSKVSKVIEKVENGEYLQLQIKRQSFRDNIMYGLWYNYNSNDYYSSLADYDYVLTQNYVGSYGNNLNAENGTQEQTPVTNIIFPVKYFFDGQGYVKENQFRKLVDTVDGCNLFENNYTMPFMYTISSNVMKWTPFNYVLPAYFQNSAFKAYTGTDEGPLIFNENTNFSFENCKRSSFIETLKNQEEEQGIAWNDESNEFYQSLEDQMASYTVTFEDLSKDAYVHYTSVAQSDGIQYIYVETTSFTDLIVKINGETRKYYTYGIGENRTYELGEVKKGDKIEISIGGHKSDSENGLVYGASGETFASMCFTVDMSVFEEGYQKLDAMSDTEMLEFEDTYVKAKVTSYEDGMLYIPTAYDEGWTITIDGEEVPLYEHESHILMTEISKGEHIVEMKYVPQGFIPGAVITGVSVLILIAWAVISTKRFKKEQESDIIVSNDVNEE